QLHELRQVRERLPNRGAVREGQGGDGDGEAPRPAAVAADHARASTMSAEQRNVRMATVWLDGCSGCHMSFLDLDERLIEIAKRGVHDQVVPRLLPQVRPIHEYVPVDIFLQGCPPPADVIYGLLTDLVAGRTPDLTAHTRFGR